MTLFRLWPILVAFGLWGCGPSFSDAQSANTVEAFEAYLAKASKDDPYYHQAEVQLALLRLEAAQKAGTSEALDAFIKLYPEGKLPDDKVTQKYVDYKEKLLLEAAETENTAAAWERYLKETKKANKKQKAAAKRRVYMAENLSSVTLAPVRQERVNLAENPEGPLDGWGFYVDVTNSGTRPIESLYIGISYLDEQGGALDRNEWPVVAKRLPGFLPMPDGFDKPMAPGETRTWEYTTGDLTEGWSGKVKVVPTSIRFVGDKKAGSDSETESDEEKKK